MESLGEPFKPRSVGSPISSALLAIRNCISIQVVRPRTDVERIALYSDAIDIEFLLPWTDRRCEIPIVPALSTA